MDIIEVESYNNIVYPGQYFDAEEYEMSKEVIFNQLENLNNLGQDLLSDLDLDLAAKNKLYLDIINFIKENYINIVDTDYIQNNTQLEKVANLTYQFICVDCYNTILPKVLDELNCKSIDQFNVMINKKHNDINFIKTIILTCLSETLNNLLKLQKIDHTIVNDDHYKKLVGRFGYYLELIDFSDSFNLLENYIKPVLTKNFNNILWRVA